MLNLKTNRRSTFYSAGRVFPLLLFLLAFLPRLAAIGRYVTPDELTWVYRSIHFRQALLNGDWANTIQTGHPGVITTWLGALGIQLQLWLRPASAADLEWLLTLHWLAPDNSEGFRHLAVFLTAGRLAVVTVTSLGVVVIYRLARSRLGGLPAVLGCLLLALDPFAAGLSGLLHVDALLATFSLISILLVLPARTGTRGPRLAEMQANLPSEDRGQELRGSQESYLAGTKSDIPTLSQAEIPNPNLIPSGNPKSQTEIPNTKSQIPKVKSQRSNPKSQIPNPKFQVVLAGVTTGLAVLAKSPGVLLFAFVPAVLLWPLVRSLFTKIRERSNHAESIPLRQAIVSLFYWFIPCALTLLILLPAVWADPGNVIGRIGGMAEQKVVGQSLRPDFFLGEPTFRPGLHFYPIALFFRLSPVVLVGLMLLLVGGRFAKSPYKWPPAVPWLLLFSVAFLLFLNLSQRKFDRYMLPAVLPLILVSGVPFALVARRFPKLPYVVGFLQLAFLVAYWPYPLTAYNWLGGGTAVARHVLPMGWGEDTSAAARWLAENRAAELEGGYAPLFTNNVPAAAPFYAGPVYPLNKGNLARAANGSYYVALVSQDWQPDPAVAAVEPPPIHQIRFNGLERARIYTAVPPILAMETPALVATPQFYRFNQALQIVETAVVPATWPDRIPLLIGWQALQPADYQLRYEVRDAGGHAWSSFEVPLLNDADQPARYWPAAMTQPSFYEQAIPPDLPPGRYSLAVVAFDEQGAQMGVFDEEGRFAGTAAAITSFDLAAPASQPALSIPIPLNDDEELAGYAPLPAEVGTGEQLVLDLWWRAPAEREATQLALQLGDSQVVAPLAMDGWRVGQTYHIRPTWTIPADLAAGRYDLALQPLTVTGDPGWPQAISLGQVQVIARDRLFELPAGLQPLDVQVGSLARLQQATAEQTAEGVLVSLVWHAEEPDGRAYSTFVHLRDASGQIVAQIDRPPAEPSDSWLPGQVILDEFLLQPSSLDPNATYTVAIGLYDPTSGRRWPVYTAAGEPLPDDQYIVEVAR